MPPVGYFTFILHCHMPWVLHHGRWPHGTDWLSESIAETYLPLLNMCESLVAKDILPKFTIDISPILAEQLSHPDLTAEFTAYLDQKIEAAKYDISEYTYWEAPHMKYLAERWFGIYSALKEDFLRREGNILAGFRALEEQGAIELITCGITHGYMPLLGRDWCCRLQVSLAQMDHEKHFGKRATGIWLPEMAYLAGGPWQYPESLYKPGISFDRQSVENILSEVDLDYFTIGFHLMEKARQHIPKDSKKTEQINPLVTDKHTLKYLACKPFIVGDSADFDHPVSALVRNPETAILVGLQFNPGEKGYPSRGPYLDFSKRHFPGGMAYWQVTNLATPIEHKYPYVPELAQEQLIKDANDFEYKVRHLLTTYQDQKDEAGFLVAPYDGELFGHWWNEGVDWLGAVIERLHQRDEIKLVTASEYLAQQAPNVNYDIPEGSWGEGGGDKVWLNISTAWTWQMLWEQQDRFEEFIREVKAKNWRPKDGVGNSVVLQAARELLLAQASDWQFLISGGAARDYAERRFREHATALQQTLDMCQKLLAGINLDEQEVKNLELLAKADDPFPWLSFEKLLEIIDLQE
jgi:1,4-alpha-glucan branching enzyme